MKNRPPLTFLTQDAFPLCCFQEVAGCHQAKLLKHLEGAPGFASVPWSSKNWTDYDLMGCVYTPEVAEVFVRFEILCMCLII